MFQKDQMQIKMSKMKINKKCFKYEKDVKNYEEY